MGNRELSMRLENVEGNKNPLDAKCDGWCMEKIKVERVCLLWPSRLLRPTLA
jgi:hypothetical protein